MGKRKTIKEGFKDFVDNIKKIPSNIANSFTNDKDLVYAIMSGKDNNYSEVSTRSLEDVLDAKNNKKEYVANRGNYDRNLASLYVYGNDLGQFEEAPELRNVGVEYDKFLRENGRNPNSIKTYKGNISSKITLPIESKEDLINYIKSKNNHTFGAFQYDEKDDDVANYTQRLTLDKNGNPIVVNSDLWDFGKDYGRQWNWTPTHGITQLKANLLDKAGTPFILKDTHPVEFTSIDDFYDKHKYGDNDYWYLFNNSFRVAQELGYLPEINIIYDKNNKKQYYEWQGYNEGNDERKNKRRSIED